MIYTRTFNNEQETADFIQRFLEKVIPNEIGPRSPMDFHENGNIQQYLYYTPDAPFAFVKLTREILKQYKTGPRRPLDKCKVTIETA